MGNSKIFYPKGKSLATKAMKLAVLVIMDKDVTDEEFDFKMSNVTMHFPDLIFFKDGKILSGVKNGHENAEADQLDLCKKLR